MTENNVKSYTDKQIIDRIVSLDSFKGFPEGYFFVGIQSNEDAFNKFDDKMYLFLNSGPKIVFIRVTSCTTNAGVSGLKNYSRYNWRGVAVIKTNEWYYDLWAYGYHKGRMPALRQMGDILIYRDNNKNNSVEEKGRVYKGWYGINFHTVTYSNRSGFFRRLIGGWSVGCQVLNNYNDYKFMLNQVRYQRRVSYVLIKEF